MNRYPRGLQTGWWFRLLDRHGHPTGARYEVTDVGVAHDDVVMGRSKTGETISLEMWRGGRRQVRVIARKDVTVVA